MFKVITRIPMILGSIIISLVITEYIFQKTKLVNKIINPEQFEANINEQGFRVKAGTSPYSKEPGDCLRIICLGDSYTFGHGVSDDKTYPAFLETYLRNICKKKIQVINAGVCGATITEELGMYKNNCVQLRHQLVILLFDNGDILDFGRELLFEKRDWQRNWDNFDKYLHKSKIYNLMKYTTVKQRSIWADNFLKNAKNHTYYSENKIKYFDNLKNLNKIVGSQNAKLIVVIFKSLTDSDEEEFRDFCIEEHIPIIDITEKYEQKKKSSDIVIVYHHNEQGNLFLAKTIADKLIDRGIIYRDVFIGR